jgi:nucleolar protein 6
MNRGPPSQFVQLPTKFASPLGIRSITRFKLQGCCFNIVRRVGMSRTENGLPKKRKLADTDHDEVVPSPERPVIAHRPSKENRDNIYSPVSAPARTLQDTELETVSKPESEERERKHIPCKLAKIGPSTAEILEENSQIREAAGDGEGAGQIRRPEPKDKAASRQAKSERRSKKRRKPALAAIAPATEPSLLPEASVSIANEQDQNEEQSELPLSEQSFYSHPSKSDPKQRFIVFVGNLPYTASTSTIRSHFSKLAPFAVRHSTDKSTGRSRGFAFLEFEGYDRMKTCLKLYHHSLFDVGGELSSGKGGRKCQTRKINVELTAGGGGGKSTARRARIRGKNEKLDGERERARLHREKEEAAADRKKMKAGGKKTGANAVDIINGEAGHDRDLNIHPSRRKRMEIHHQ